MNPLKGELEYGSISLDGKEDYRLYRYSDAGMGETEYRIFRNGAFFAMFDNRKDAEEVMTAMTHQSERDEVLDDLISWIRETKDMARDNLDHDWGTKNDRHVELILSRVLDKYDELRQAGKL